MPSTGRSAGRRATTRQRAEPNWINARRSKRYAHHAEVRAFLIKYFGTDQNPELDEPLHTVTTKDRFGLVTVQGVEYQIVDIGMRMLSPRELYRAQGFPDTYIIDTTVDGKKLSKAAQVRMCGNSVSPVMAKAIVSAKMAESVMFDNDNNQQTAAA